MTIVPPSPAFLRRHARVWLNLLQTFARDLPLDGEIELPDGRAVSWKELAGDTRYVLAKSMRGIALTEREAIWHSQHWN
ncbi:phosphoribosyl-dephospho-CoA transferase MdcG domain-containing protein [Oxalicibacterium solurbis]|uniref:Phosphoribosyl-dephospho-CoA transferase MdcG C-terminal domain-containing protein n=1 Tax=Oxalicibacterium solurbis TaxID=69280 RepID=A0A8J3B5M6_9BURK|nr:phosphoribosyl-dephospho-CoA transferase MdcG domain-containing protein [Oxalicibacterium solurbis]GGI55568.1 hypothetical protein GCM10011430_27420 [Oxalicibacterium solurbis]